MVVGVDLLPWWFSLNKVWILKTPSQSLVEIWLEAIFYSVWPVLEIQSRNDWYFIYICHQIKILIFRADGCKCQYSFYLLQLLTCQYRYTFVLYSHSLVGPMNKVAETSFFCWRLHKHELLKFVWYKCIYYYFRSKHSNIYC